MKVKCIDPSATMGTLAKDKVYEVAREGKENYTLARGVGSWKKKRFVIVDDAAIVAPTTSSSSKIAASAVSSINEEERLRAILTAPRPGNCACDMPKSQCWMHKGL